MAAFDTTRPIAPATAVGGLLKPISAAFGALLAWKEARDTRKALRQLSAHQLNDIGLISADIDLFIAKYR